MALGTYTYYGTEWTNAYISSPSGHNYAQGSRARVIRFTWNSAAAGAADQTIGLFAVPPLATLYPIFGYFKWANWTATATLSIGWAAYTDVDGAAQAASAAGIINAQLMTTASTWSHGMLLTATPDDANPVDTEIAFNNRDEVGIFGTVGVTGPGATATLQGAFLVVTP